MLLGNIGRNDLFTDLLSNSRSAGKGLLSHGSDAQRRPPTGPFQKFCCTAAPDNYNVYDDTDLHIQQKYWGEEPISTTRGRGNADEEIMPSKLGLQHWPAALTTQGQKHDSADLIDKPEMDLEDGMRYKGQWKDQARHGYGVLTKPPGRKYEGSFENNQMHGHGVWTDASGITYDGQWCRGYEHGRGKYIHVDSTTYDGEWADGVKSGRGVEHWADGAQYEGEFLQGKKHGSGAYTSGNGAEYSGQWSQDAMHGEGRYKFADGRVYAGKWQLGRMTGHGRMDFPNGSVHVGEFETGLQNGEGTLTRADGIVFHGQWEKGKQHGTGCAIDANGVVTRGTWSNGQQQKNEAGLERRPLSHEQTVLKAPTLLSTPLEAMKRQRLRIDSDDAIERRPFFKDEASFFAPAPPEYTAGNAQRCEKVEKRSLKDTLEATGDELAQCEVVTFEATRDEVLHRVTHRQCSVTELDFTPATASEAVNASRPTSTLGGRVDPYHQLAPCMVQAVDYSEHLRPFRTQLHGGYFPKRASQMQNRRDDNEPNRSQTGNVAANEPRRGFPSVEAQEKFWSRISANS